MNTKMIGFIGGGRVTGIILEGWRRRNALPARIVVSDCNAAVLANLQQRFPGLETAAGNAAAAAADIVFLAVHPRVMAEVAAEIEAALRPEAKSPSSITPGCPCSIRRSNPECRHSES